MTGVGASGALLAQVRPFRVRCLDECHFPLTPPSLDLLLPRDCRPDVRGGLEIHETIDPIFRSESGNEGIPVLEHPAGEIVRDACVKGLRTVRGYVDEVLVLPSHYRWSISPPEGTGADPSLRSG